MRKAFRLKLLELCKTRTMKSSPDMFNFYVILAGHYMITDASKTTTCRREIKPLDFKRKYENEVTFENMGFNGKTV